MAQSLDKDTLYDLLDRLNILEHAQLGVERTRPVQTATRLKETLQQKIHRKVDYTINKKATHGVVPGPAGARPQRWHKPTLSFKANTLTS